MTSRVMIVVFLLATCQRMPAEQGARSASREVVVTGVGTSDEAALQDAFRTAIRSVAGTLVDSETVTRDGHLSRRNLVTFSQGIVQSYRTLSRRRLGSEVHVRIAAVVQKQPVQRRLNSANLSSYQLDGSSLFAQAASRHHTIDSAEALLDRKLRRFPLNVVQVRIPTSPRVVETNGNYVTLALDIQARVDTNRFRFARDELLELMNEVASQRGELVARYALINEEFQSAGKKIFHDRFMAFHPSEESQFARFWALSSSRAVGAVDSEWRPTTQSGDELLVLLKTELRELDGSYRWRWFRLRHPQITHDPRLKIRVRFLDDKQSVIQEAGITLGPDLPGWSYDRPNDTEMASLWLTPYLTFHRGSGCRVHAAAYAKALTVTQRLQMATSELRRIHRVDLVVEDVTPDS